MKNRVFATFVTAAIAVISLAGCVSSKKYKASQASLQQMRNDSVRLAQEVSTLNQNVQTLEQKNKSIQQSLDSTSNNYVSQQKSLDYYETYFSKQQTSLSQIGEELKTALTQAGITNGDVQQMSDGIYINLDEANTFKNNSAAVTTTGKQALNGVAQVLKNHPDVNVTIASGDNSTDQSTMSNNNSSENSTTVNKTTNDNSSTSPASNQSDRTVVKHKYAAKKTVSTTGAATKTKTSSTPATDKDVAVNKTHTAVKHKKTTKTTGSENYPTSYSYSGKSKTKSSALKSGRINTVANSLLQNGVQKVNLRIQQPSTETGNMNSGSGSVKIIVSPTMNDFKPEKNSSASRQ